MFAQPTLMKNDQGQKLSMSVLGRTLGRDQVETLAGLLALLQLPVLCGFETKHSQIKRANV